MSDLKPALINSDIIHELFRVSSSLLAVVDEQLRFQIISPAYCEYFAKSNDDIIGQTVEAIYDTSQFDKLR